MNTAKKSTLPIVNTMTRSLEDIMEYEKLAIASLPFTHPHYEEIKQLLTDQINDEIRDYALQFRP